MRRAWPVLGDSWVPALIPSLLWKRRAPVPRPHPRGVHSSQSPMDAGSRHFPSWSSGGPKMLTPNIQHLLSENPSRAKTLWNASGDARWEDKGFLRACTQDTLPGFPTSSKTLSPSSGHAMGNNVAHKSRTEGWVFPGPWNTCHYGVSSV